MKNDRFQPQRAVVYWNLKKGWLIMPVTQFSHGSPIADHPEGIPRLEEFQTASILFKLLSDVSRLRIFWLLCHCEVCGTELAAMVDMTPPAVSHHLRLLRSSHLLVSRRDGKEVYYRAADTVQAQALHHMIEEMLEISCPKNLSGDDHG